MSFEEFKIKLVSVAKLPHADTYYACFEYKNHDKCNEQCVVSFNAAIQASQIRAYRKLRAFFNDFDLNIEKKMFVIILMITVPCSFSIML